MKMQKKETLIRDCRKGYTGLYSLCNKEEGLKLDLKGATMVKYIILFKVEGSLKYLSHLELMKLFVNVLKEVNFQ